MHIPLSLNTVAIFARNSSEAELALEHFSGSFLPGSTWAPQSVGPIEPDGLRMYVFARGDRGQIAGGGGAGPSKVFIQRTAASLEPASVEQLDELRGRVVEAAVDRAAKLDHAIAEACDERIDDVLDLLEDERAARRGVALELGQKVDELVTALEEERAFARELERRIPGATAAPPSPPRMVTDRLEGSRWARQKPKVARSWGLPPDREWRPWVRVTAKAIAAIAAVTLAAGVMIGAGELGTWLGKGHAAHDAASAASDLLQWGGK